MLYLDASAIVKLVSNELHRDALRARVRGAESCTAAIGEVETVRAAVRRDPHVGERRAHEVLAGMVIVEANAVIRSIASTIGPASLRSMDAMHLATALQLRADLDAFICYDRRLCDAARAHGLVVESPGADT